MSMQRQLCCLNFLPSHSGQQTVQHAASRRYVLADLLFAVQSVIRASSERQGSMDCNENLHGSTKIKYRLHLFEPMQGLSRWLIGIEFDLVNATHTECYTLPPPLPPKKDTCSVFLPSTTPHSSAFAPAAVNSRIAVCVSVHPSLFSPLHPSIPFFHVCSAVKPSWIRPASLVTCSLCWCGNKRC